MENVESLVKVAREGDPDASAKLLQDAGGSCQAVELAKAAKELSKRDGGAGVVDYTIDPAGKKENLALWVVNGDIWESVGSVEQAPCKK